MAHRYFTDNIFESTAQIIGDDAKHLSRVLRLKLGEQLIVCDGNKTDYTTKVSEISEDKITLEIISSQKNVSEPSVAVTLFVGYPKGDKLEWIIQKAVELGAVKIVPFFSKFCVVTAKKEEQKNQRYNKIAYEAAKQCGRGIIPEVAMPVTFAQMLKMQPEFDLSLFCYEAQDGSPSLHSQLQNKQTVAVITGAEGGFAEDEVAQAQNFSNVISLGKRILRCETAPLAAISAVMVLTGNLQ